MAFSLSIPRLLRASASFIQMLWRLGAPVFRRVRAQRAAAQGNAGPSSTTPRDALSETLEWLTGRSAQPAWWNAGLARAKRLSIAPNSMFAGESLNPWLDDAGTREQLLTILDLGLSGIPDVDGAATRARIDLRAGFERVVGDRGRLADSHIDVIVNVTLARLQADLSVDAGATATVLHSSATAAILSGQVTRVSAGVSALGEQLDRIVADGRPPDSMVAMLDESCVTELLRILRRRVIPGHSALQRITSLVADLGAGGKFVSCSPTARAKVLLWAARLHATDQPDLADAYRRQLLQVSAEADTHIVDVWLTHARGDGEAAVRMARRRADAESRTAIFNLMHRMHDPARALAWLDGHAPFGPELLTPVGWYNAAVVASEAGRWSEAAGWLATLGGEHISECPDLLYLAGVLNASLIFPSDLRAHAMSMSVEITSMAQAGAEADSHRRVSMALFAQASTALRAIGAPDRAAAADRWCTWLRLTSPATREQAEAEITAAMARGPTAVDMVELACVCKVPFEEGPLLEHLRRCRLSGQLEPAEQAASFHLHKHRRTATEFADFLVNERDALKPILKPGGYAGQLVAALAAAGLHDRADAALREHRAELGADGDRLADMLRAGRGEDVLPSFETRYAETDSLVDLANLVDALGGRDPEKAAHYGQVLFDRQRTPRNALRAATGLAVTGRHADAVTFLDRCEDLVSEGPDLLALKGRCLLILARFNEVKPLVARLLEVRDLAEDVALDVNVAIATCDWEHLAAVLDREYPKRDGRTAEHLLRLASICSEANHSRAVEMLSEAARKAPSDPTLLAGAGMLAVQLGREDVGFPLVNAAARLSSEDGPIRSLGREAAIGEIGDTLARFRSVSAALARAEIPLAMACPVLNTSITQILVNRARLNERLPNWRQRTVIPFRHGGRSPVDISRVRTVAADFTSLIVAADLGLLDRLAARFDRIVLPWTTAEQLMSEARQARFHQPSQVKAAKRLRALLTSVPPRVAVVSPIGDAPRPEREKFGDELLSLLSVARARNGRVIASKDAIGPETRRELDALGYGCLLASPADVVRALWAQGEADTELLESAGRLLGMVDLANGGSVDLPPGPICLDQVATDHLQAAGVLDALHRSGREILVSEATAVRAYELEQTDGELGVAMDAIEAVRTWFRNGLEQGRVTVAPSEELDAVGSRLAPTLLELARIQVVDAVMMEDRALGRSTVWQGPPGAVPLFGLVDLLADLVATGAMEPSERWRRHHVLRRRMYSGVPLLPDELEHWLAGSMSDAETGAFTPCAELRTAREYMLCLRGAAFLLQPPESPWLDGIHLSGIMAIRRCWSEGGSDPATARRASWLYESFVRHPQDWLHGPDMREVAKAIPEVVARHIGMLLPPTSTDQARVREHAEWLGRTVLAGLVPGSPEILDMVTGHARDLARRWQKTAPPGVAERIAGFVINSQPDLIRKRLVADRDLLSDCGVETDASLRFGDGPTLSQRDLVRAVEALERTGERQSLYDEGGAPVIVSRGLDGLELATSDGATVIDAARDIMRVLSSDRAEREAGGAGLMASAAFSGPEASRWEEVLATRPLNDEEVGRLIQQVGDAPHARLLRAEAGIAEGRLDLHELFPTDFCYYERLCAPCEGHGPEEFFRYVLPSHIRARLARNPEVGLDLWLASCLRDDVAWHDLWPGTVDELWDTLQTIPLRADPFSALGGLALCLRNAHDPRFVGLAEALVRMLCSPAIDRGDGIGLATYFPHLVAMADQRLRKVPGMSGVPVWWRDLCAWSQACVAARALLSVDFGGAEVTSILPGALNEAAFLGRFLDLRQSPNRRLGDLDAPGLRAEILVRLQLLRSRCDQEEKSFPAADALEQFERDARSAGFWDKRTLPGPLESHDRPLVRPGRLPREVRREFGKVLAIRPGKPCWPQLGILVALSHWERFGERVGTRCAEIVRQAPQEDAHDGLPDELGHLALMAVRQDWHILGRAVLERAVAAFTERVTIAQAMGLTRVALLAAQVLPEEEAMMCFGDAMTAAALRSGSEGLQGIEAVLDPLRRLVPVDGWWAGRASTLAIQR